ncbi:MAG: Fur family transcriptional regulator [Defluviicoccus sp.]|nr:Fur family transcriptional regulator [Defluviicoccus sp.]MDE0384815.1 Fur family transcriptional regulator [Defluviicoccus sp.]
MQRSYTPLIETLRRHGLRPTRQRLALARLLFTGANRHVSAERLHEEALGAGASVSLATVYNTLNQFTAAGLLREVIVDPDRSYFDTNTTDHHHLYFQDTGRLEDIEAAEVHIGDLPDPPAGTTIARVDLVIRLAGRPD